MRKPEVKEIKRNFGGNMTTKLKLLFIEGEKFFYSLSFDTYDFIGDGIWFLQVYDDNLNLIYDKQVATSMGRLNKGRILQLIRNEFIAYRGGVL